MMIKYHGENNCVLCEQVVVELVSLRCQTIYTQLLKDRTSHSLFNFFSFCKLPIKEMYVAVDLLVFTKVS